MTDTANLDLLPVDDPDFRADPYPYYARLHAEAPIFKHPHGFWALTRHADVTRILFDRTVTVAQIDFGPASLLHNSPLGADQPDHGRLRKAMSRWFTARAVADWRKLAQSHLDECLAEIVSRGGDFDAILDLAFPVTFRTICDILGVEPAAALELRKATYLVGAGLSSNPTPEEVCGVADAMGWFVSHAETLITLKDQSPGTGLLDSFLEAERHGEMTRDETVGSLILLFAVGHLDITYLIAHGLRRFAETPEIAETYRSEPSSRSAIIEELLRIDTPEQFVTRMTTEPIDVGGVRIPAGEILLLFIGAANADPEVFRHPAAFDHTRDFSQSKHVAFGAGIHGCAGQVLARAEADLVFTTIVERFEGVTSTGPVEYGHTDFIRSIKRLPLKLVNRATPAPAPAEDRFVAGEQATDVVLDSVEPVADDVVALTFIHPDGADLPSWTPGAHLDLVLGENLIRQYSLCGPVADTKRYRVAVLKQAQGRGGSVAVHALTVGSTVRIRGPRNHFPLTSAPRYQFIAGGIGITPILPMIAAAEASGADWHLLYGGRSRASMAFLDELHGYGDRVTVVAQDEVGYPNLEALIGTPQPGTAVYCCGPTGLLDAVEDLCQSWPPGSLHFERFAAKAQPPVDADSTFDVVLARSGMTLAVPANKSIYDACRDAGVSVLGSCLEGICGTCETTVLDGQVEHRDSILTDEERATNTCMMICVSRCASGQLTLDL